MKKNALISSILTIALCVSLIAGSTFALFTSEDSINVAVTAAKVKVSATVDNLQTYSMDALQSAGSFENGGTAAYDEATGKLTLTNVAPGDKVTFDIEIENTSNIKIQYRVTQVITGALKDALVSTVDGQPLVSSTSGWTVWDIPQSGSETKTLTVSLELPADAGDEYQEADAEITFIVEAVQSNGTELYKSDVNSAESLAAAFLNGGEIVLTEDVVLEEGALLEIAAGKEVVLDLNGKTLTGSAAKSAGALVNNEGLLTVKGGTLENTTVNGGAVINNTGSLVLDGAEIIGAPIGDGGYPSYAVTTAGNLTIEDGTAITSERGALAIKGAGTTIINGGVLTNEDIDRSLTSHVVDLSDEAGAHKLVINGGTFRHLHDETSGGVVICNRTTNTVYVNGGSFSGGNYFGNDNLSDYGYGGTFAVTGGTYTAKPANAYIAAGCEAVTNADGTFSVVVSGNEGLDAAIKNGAPVVTLGSGNYIIPDSAQGKTLTIVGNGDTVVANQNDGSYEGCDYSLDGAKVTFENVTINTDGHTYAGYARCSATYNNCTINGSYTLYGESVFNDCEFNVTGDYYNIWTWGAKAVEFNDCTFNTDGKSILVYNQSCDVYVNDCTFNDRTNGTGFTKSALETGVDGVGPKYNIYINNTTFNGFAENDTCVGYENIVGNKNNMSDEYLNIVIDGVDVY